MLLFEPGYVLVMLVGLALTAWAQFKVKSNFTRFSKVGVRSGLSGAEAAAAVCRAGNVQGIRIERHAGFLSDHYDPRAKALRLSPDVYDGRSVAAIAVAAHEAGHSIQDATSYRWLDFRTAMVGVTNIGNRMWALPFILGLIVGGAFSKPLMLIGIFMFAAVVLFQLVTLPVEIDASNRAKAVLATAGIVQTQEEAQGVSKVLDAAAWTYVAAALAGVLQLLYMIARLNSRD